MAFTPPTAEHHLARLRADAPTFGAVPADAMDRPVEACPGWAVRDLVAHVAMIHGWCAGNVRQLAPIREHVELAQPREDIALIAWADEQARTLVDVLTATDPDALMWTHVGGGPASYWFRRMAHETGVHLLDLQDALGAPGEPMLPVDAADGVDEFLHVYATKRDRHGHLRGAGEQLVLHAQDADATWLITCAADDGEVVRLDGPSDAPAGAPVVRTDAATLLRTLWGRGDARTAEIDGDTAMVAVVLGRLRATAI